MYNLNTDHTDVTLIGPKSTVHILFFVDDIRVISAKTLSVTFLMDLPSATVSAETFTAVQNHIIANLKDWHYLLFSLVWY